MDNNYHSECGRDAPSTVESLRYNNDKQHKQVHMPTIDEDDDSIISEDLSNEEMLNRLYGNKPNENIESSPDSGVNNVNNNDFKVYQKSPTYITEAKVDELLHGTSNEGKVWAETGSRDQVDPHANPIHLEGQYIEHNAASTTIPQPITILPSACIPPDGAYIMSGSDGACNDQMTSTAQSHSFDDNGPYDASNHCSTPTTALYQSYIDNNNNLQPLPSHSDVRQPVVPFSNNALRSVDNTSDICDSFTYVHLLDNNTGLTSVSLRQESVANPPVLGITRTAVHHPVCDTTQEMDGNYVGHNIASSDMNTGQLSATNASVLASHYTESLGECVSHSAVGDVYSTHGFPQPSSQEITLPLDRSRSELKPNSVSSTSSAPYVTLNKDNESFASPLANNTQASGEYVPYNTAANCDERINDCGQTDSYLPYSANDKIGLPTFDALAKENDLSNGYFTTSV